VDVEEIRVQYALVIKTHQPFALDAPALVLWRMFWFRCHRTDYDLFASFTTDTCTYRLLQHATTEFSHSCYGAIESLIFLCAMCTPETIGQNVLCHFVVELETYSCSSLNNHL
jgi:hypothetical protein